MADDPIKQRLDSIYNLLNGKIVKLDEKESIIAGNASSTLKAIGLTDEQALSTIRITVDETLNQHDIFAIAKILKGLIEQLRES